MISMDNLGVPQDALDYFSADNYYTQDEGLEHSEWFGKGAEYLGLSGKVDNETFFTLLSGEVNGEKLGKVVKNEETGKKEREHRAGVDITFSAPKSVSLMAEVHGRRDVREAHEEAVKTALKYIEREMIRTRQTVNGKTRAVKTGNMTVALFRHNTSRDLDPQTHTHAILINATKRKDRQWRSLDNDEIWKAQHLINAIYISELANRLQAIGYDLNYADGNEKGNFEIAGITRKQIETFSQRRAEIEATLNAKGVDINNASAKQKENAALKTRKHKTKVDQADLIQEWKNRAREAEIPLDAIQAKVDQRQPRAETVPSAGERQPGTVPNAGQRQPRAETVPSAGERQPGTVPNAGQHQPRAETVPSAGERQPGTVPNVGQHQPRAETVPSAGERQPGTVPNAGQHQPRAETVPSAGERQPGTVPNAGQRQPRAETVPSAGERQPGTVPNAGQHQPRAETVPSAGERQPGTEDTNNVNAQQKEDVVANFDVIQAKADAQRAQDGVARNDKLSGYEAISFAAAHLTEREVVVSKRKLMQVAVEHGVGRVSILEVERAFEKLEKDGDLVALPDGNYTTKRMLNSEMWALNQVRDQKGRTLKIMEPKAVMERIAQAEGRQGFKYSEGQKEAISKVLTSEDRYIGVQGLAGTGKTTMLKSLREMAQEQGYTVRGMAPTGVASKVLAKEAGIMADTVSMFQIKEWQLQKDIAFAKQYAPDFQRKAEIWIVDESSFLSQRQKAKLDHMAEKAGAKVVYLGDTLQLQGVEAGKPFELAQRDGMETAYMTEINRQKVTDLKEAVDIITGRDNLGEGQRLTQVELTNNARAFEYMDKAGMIREISEKSKEDNGGLIEAVVQDILKLDKAERERTIVITAYNADRRAINDGVREGLKEQGELSRSEDTREIYTSKGWTRAMQKEAQYYKRKDVVRFGRDYQQIDAKKGEYMRVSTVNRSDGTVTLQKEDGTLIVWQPKKHNKIEVYDCDNRRLAQGDLIRITRNDGEFKNGEVARVASVAGDIATLELRQDKDVSLHQVNLSRSKHWDYAYAQTIHASQGATQHRAIFHIRAPQTENEKKEERALDMAKVFGNRSFYVGVTRASHELRIYTDDKAAAAKAVASKQDKTSAVETIQRHERATATTTDKTEKRSVSSRSEVQR